MEDNFSMDWGEGWFGDNSSALHLLGTSSLLGLPGGSDGEESACNAVDLDSIPVLGRSSWRWAWQPTPVFLPGESHGQRSLTGYSPYGCKESDMTEWLTLFLLLLHRLHLISSSIRSWRLRTPDTDYLPYTMQSYIIDSGDIAIKKKKTNRKYIPPSSGYVLVQAMQWDQK